MVAAIPTVTVGGFSVSAADRPTAAAMMICAAAERAGAGRPLYFTSINGEVIARARTEEDIKPLFSAADQILADGQPLVLASRWLCHARLPERVATTDLFHDVARLAEQTGTTFYMLGADEEENQKAVAAVRAAYPKLRLVGHSHGYLQGAALEEKIDEINRLAPDILWLALGVPLEQRFVRSYSARLGNVGVIKTSGGLFNFLSGKNSRAPSWMQKAGFEWLWRMLLEPRRLSWRYLTTNPRALYALLKYSE
ncbi:MAG: WecB/TagA/CpsF family glycosyltransferase [Mesorhizobium sp.]|nr:WecB/TagA/CpsF family glycosyltransferase [Mesorhizobium sp.]MBN9241783.1 WecB/TagA/CpsF family glycosyltransferase [Mesorhizobium sp.]